MALSMEMVREWSDVVGYCENEVDYESGLTDTESGGEEEEEEEYAFAYAPVAYERTVVARRSTKRTYGVFLEREVEPVRRKRSRVDEQLELLRDAIPNLCTNEKSEILVGAYEYIERLQRQVQELQSELDAEGGDSDDDDDVSSCEDSLSGEEERSVDSNAGLEVSCSECCGDSLPTVEVVRTEEGLKIHIQCEKRPRVLADIMELLESSGMNVEQISIVYQDDSQFVFDCVGSELDGKGIAADSRHVEACLRSLIADERDIASPE
ncbi:hypothetical protein M758_8G156800 [Ceratodon purpureus]|nr:hypothetical protein M758_8G156800 [Ceratodon purpureus]